MATADGGLRKSIGLVQAVGLYFAAVVGAGVLVLPGLAAQISGAGSLWAWVVASLLGLPLALTFAALAARFPDAGGMSVYVANAFAGPWGDLAGWFYLIAAATGQVIVPLTGAEYVASAFHVSPGATTLLALVLLAAAVGLNVLGLRLGAGVQVALSALVALTLLTTAAVATPHIPWNALRPSGADITAIGQTVVLIFFAFSGWEAIAPLAEEFRDPARDVPRATYLTAGLITVVYVGVALAVVGTGVRGDTAVMTVLARATGLALGPVMATVAVLICLGTTNAFVAGASRLAYGLARRTALPAALARLSSRKVPAAAAAAIGLYAAAGLALTGALGWSLAPILQVTDAFVLSTYVLVMAAGVCILRGSARVLAGVGLLAYAATLPFAGASLLAPGALAAGAVAVRGRTKTGRGPRGPRGPGAPRGPSWPGSETHNR